MIEKILAAVRRHFLLYAGLLFLAQDLAQAKFIERLPLLDYLREMWPAYVWLLLLFAATDCFWHWARPIDWFGRKNIK